MKEMIKTTRETGTRTRIEVRSPRNWKKNPKFRKYFPNFVE